MNYTDLSFLAITSPWDSWNLSIDFNSGEVETVTIVQKTWINLSIRDVLSIRKKLAECHMEDWVDRYEKAVYDGFHWHLTIYNGDEIIRDISGANDYPPCNQWRPFVHLMDRLYERTLKHGNIEVFPTFNAPYKSDNEK